LLHWRIGTWRPAQQMLATIFACVPKSFRFTQGARLPMPRLCLTASTLASSEGTHRHFSECSPVLIDCHHCRLLPLGKHYCFDDVSHFRYVVQSMYCMHRARQQCFSVSGTLAHFWLEVLAVHHRESACRAGLYSCRTLTLRPSDGCGYTYIAYTKVTS